MKEEVFSFTVDGHKLYGIKHFSLTPSSTVVLMIIGGPQTRIGSHRSYVQIARDMSQRGVNVIRFDYAGNGDADGNFIGFDGVDSSIMGAIDYIQKTFPALKKLLIWSLCDGAAATAMLLPKIQQQVDGLILCNPYIHTEQGQAKAMLKHYYLQRFFSKDFFKKVLSFKFNPVEAIQSLGSMATKVLFSKSEAAQTKELSLPEKVYQGLLNYTKPITLLLSTEDFTAKEFEDYYRAQSQTAKILESGQVKIKVVQGSDHTFSTMASKKLVCNYTWEAIQPFQKGI